MPRLTPTETVRSFVAAWNSAEFGSAAAYVKDGEASPYMTRSGFRGSRWPQFTVSNLADTIFGNRAVVDFDVVTAEEGEDSVKSQGFLVLVNVGGAWLIEGNQVLEVVEAANIFMSRDAFEEKREAAITSTCVKNLKQLALGMLIFLNDSDEGWKELTTQNWFEQITPYLKGAKAVAHPDKVIYCPGDESGGPSYSFNAWLTGNDMLSLDSPTDTVLLYEGIAGCLEFRHHGRACVAFVDGVARLVDAEEAATLRWKP